MYRPVAAPAGRSIENRSFAERAQVSPPAGKFALSSGFVGLIFLIFPASLGLSDRTEDHVTLFRLEQTRERIPIDMRPLRVMRVREGVAPCVRV